MGRYEDLVAYQQATALADDLRAEVSEWPPLDQWTTGVQLIRAVDSIGANLSESVGRATIRDEQRFVLFARGSAHETQHWIERALTRGLLEDASYRDRARRVGQLVNGLYRAHRKRARVTSDE